MDLREVGYNPGDLIDLAEDRDQWLTPGTLEAN